MSSSRWRFLFTLFFLYGRLLRSCVCRLQEAESRFEGRHSKPDIVQSYGSKFSREEPIGARGSHLLHSGPTTFSFSGRPLWEEVHG